MKNIYIESLVFSQIPFTHTLICQVKEALDTENIRRAAVKIMKKSKLKKIPSGEENMKREIALLKVIALLSAIAIIKVFRK